MREEQRKRKSKEELSLLKLSFLLSTPNLPLHNEIELIKTFLEEGKNSFSSKCIIVRWGGDERLMRGSGKKSLWESAKFVGTSATGLLVFFVFLPFGRWIWKCVEAKRKNFGSRKILEICGMLRRWWRKVFSSSSLTLPEDDTSTWFLPSENYKNEKQQHQHKKSFAVCLFFSPSRPAILLVRVLFVDFFARQTKQHKKYKPSTANVAFFLSLLPASPPDEEAYARKLWSGFYVRLLLELTERNF